MIPNDPLYAQQWHFGLIGNIQRIWDDYDGTGVHVGVYDDGIETSHPDLAANYDASLHFTYLGTTYAPTITLPDDRHGTAVAGLIAAVDGNGVGGVGVAHGATITGVDVFDPALTADMAIEGAMIRWASHFDIMSNSWNWDPLYADWEDIGDPGTYLSDYDDWYATIAATGRGGLGTIIVQSAGNERQNADGSGINVSRFTITVSATYQDGFAADYTNFGGSILVAAPASAVTTDLTGNNGYNATRDSDPIPVDYTSTFNGTSAATPTVSGIVALMLDAAPELGWRDVHNILALSAGHTGSAYGSGDGIDDWSWEFNSAVDWNGGGRDYDYNFGYGMVDAFAAVRMAEAWGRMSGEAQTSANEVTIAAAYEGATVSLDRNATVTASLNVTNDIEIESIYLTLSFQQVEAFDLKLWLRAPDGHEFAVLLDDSNWRLAASGLEYTFAIEDARHDLRWTMDVGRNEHACVLRRKALRFRHRIPWSHRRRQRHPRLHGRFPRPRACFGHSDSGFP